MAEAAMEQKIGKLIHVGVLQKEKGGACYLLLRKKTPHLYAWYELKHDLVEKEMELEAPHVEEALRLASRRWKEDYFRMLHCGFRYTLPERDEHGINALFHQMASSYNSMSGVYFDDDLGNNCFVQGASKEALELWGLLRTNKRL